MKCQKCEEPADELFDDPSLDRKICKSCFDILAPNYPSIEKSAYDTKVDWDWLHDFFDAKPN